MTQQSDAKEPDNKAANNTYPSNADSTAPNSADRTHQVQNTKSCFTSFISRLETTLGVASTEQQKQAISNYYAALISVLKFQLNVPSDPGKQDPQNYHTANQARVNCLQRLEDKYLTDQYNSQTKTAITQEIEAQKKYPINLNSLEISLSQGQVNPNQNPIQIITELTEKLKLEKEHFIAQFTLLETPATDSDKPESAQSTLEQRKLLSINISDQSYQTLKNLERTLSISLSSDVWAALDEKLNPLEDSVIRKFRLFSDNYRISYSPYTAFTFTKISKTAQSKVRYRSQNPNNPNTSYTHKNDKTAQNMASPLFIFDLLYLIPSIIIICASKLLHKTQKLWYLNSKVPECLINKDNQQQFIKQEVYRELTKATSEHTCTVLKHLNQKPEATQNTQNT